MIVPLPPLSINESSNSSPPESPTYRLFISPTFLPVEFTQTPYRRSGSPPLRTITPLSIENPGTESGPVHFEKVYLVIAVYILAGMSFYAAKNTTNEVAQILFLGGGAILIAFGMRTCFSSCRRS